MKSVGEGDYIFPKSVKQMCCIRHFNSIKRNRSDAKILVKSIMSNRSPVNMYHYRCLSHNFWINLHLFHILCAPVIYVCVTDCKTLSISFSLLRLLWYVLEMSHGLTLIYLVKVFLRGKSGGKLKRALNLVLSLVTGAGSFILLNLGFLICKWE